MTLVSGDFETKNGSVNLPDVGADVYAAHYDTEIMSFTFRVDHGPAQLWTPEIPNDLLYNLAADPVVWFASHASFEQAVWRWLMVPRYGFASIPIARWHDTQSACALHALPLDLDHALDVLNLPVVKDLEGKRLTIGMSRLNKKTGMLPVPTPEIMRRIYDYNALDVDGVVALVDELGPLPPRERRVWELDQAINQRGIAIDLPFVRAARVVAKRASVPLVQEFRALTGGLTPTQGEKYLAWLGTQGLALPNLQKATVAAALGEHDDEDDTEVVREAGINTNALSRDGRRSLAIRALTSSSSLSKLARMEGCAGAGGRARGLCQYHASTTGRWAGRAIGPQNIPTGTIKGEPRRIKDAILGGLGAIEAAGFTKLLDDGTRIPAEPLELVVSSLRFGLVPARGTVFGSGDFSGVEARLILALAGQHDKTAMMAAGADVYCDMASDIFRAELGGRRLTPDLAASDPTYALMRKIGKNTVLGCGFQMGWRTFRERYLGHMVPGEATDDFAKRVIKAYRRVWAPEVPKVWEGLESAALMAVQAPGKKFEMFGITYQVVGKFMVCTLLNGKPLYYFSPQLYKKQLPWTEHLQPAWTYLAKKMGAWRRIDAYGGLLTENVIQALGRELLVDAMFRFDADGWPIVLTVHDEILIEHASITDEILHQVMEYQDGWSKEIRMPINVASWVGDCYRK